jgi:hypothetical protein
MQIDITYLQNTSSLPTGFVTAVNYVVNTLDSLFTNNITLNIDVSYENLGSGVLGESEAAQQISASYSSVKAALVAEGAPGSSTLPASSPYSTNTLSMSVAEAQALGLAASSGIFDGTVYFSNQYSWSYSPGVTPSSNEFYFIGVAEHEITEVLGRVSGGLNGSYAPMDLYRYSSAGMLDLTTGGSGSTAYFSTNNGTTNLGSWNNQPSNGDLGDWYPEGPATGGNDAFNDYSNSGVINVMSSNDITLMEAIGYSTGGSSLPPPATTVSAVVESPSTGVVNAGKTVTITIDLTGNVTVAGGAPTLVLNDGGTASYSSGSGTDALIFNYTVLTGQNTADLLVTSINLNGATVKDTSGNNADFSGLANTTPAGVLQVYTTPTASVNASGFTVSVHQSVSGSSFFTITNPNGDSISEYSFEDNGGGSGHFNLAGSIEPNGQAFTVSASSLSGVQYVGGGSAGTDTLTIDAYDATAAAWLSAVAVSAVTTAPFPFANNIDITEAIYIGYFGRAGDPSGDSYWLNELNSGKISETSMAASFSVQPEATGQYAFLASPSNATLAQIDTFIEAVYQDLFNRTADSGGLAYWQSNLSASLGNPQVVGGFILNVINGALGVDQTTIANKVTVADYFTNVLISDGLSFTSSANTIAHTAIAAVTSAVSTVVAAEATINTWLATQSSTAEVAVVGTSATSIGHIY